ncbi:ABC transporter substrate-binding protein [Symbiobacterium terraclitae]|uniref:ABC transporter substrate-binding protein n=1 Tax=Symbiobacterium terraclitae TaxID=557451 RepID=UPI0035B531E7
MRRRVSAIPRLIACLLAAGLLFGCASPSAPAQPEPSTAPAAGQSAQEPGNPDSGGQQPGASEPADQLPEAVEPLASLQMQAPAAPPSILLAHLATQERLTSLVPEVSFHAFANLDQLRADMVKGQVQVAAVPTYVAANLYQKGLPVRLLNVTVWGHLSVLTADPDINGWEDLRGKTVYIPFKGDSPDLIFQIVAREAGLTADDMDLAYVSAAPEALQMLMAGKADAVVLPEPVASAAIIQGKQNGVPVRELFELRQEWGRVTGREPVIPQIGTIAVTELIDEHPEVIAAIQEGLQESVEWIQANPAEAAAIGEPYLNGLKAPVIESSLGRTPFAFVPADEAREEIEFFFTKLAELSPEIIGGGLPDAGFYYTGE